MTGLERIFAYGTLEIPELVIAITGRRFRAEAAALPGFARSMVRDATYPGIAPEPGARTEGTLYHGVDAASLAALDRFEGDLYERCALGVETAAGGRCTACVWVVRASRLHVLTGTPWDRERFRAQHLEAWLARPGGPVPR
ncbi:MAG TPA: gamma-glutamylcyclotransferase family protein [Myxococcota bacterium]|nr:gamma-glutamylcyclotransferase family protein [Myxococcota bacterium]